MYIPPNNTYNEKYNVTPVTRVNTMISAEFFSTANNLMVANLPALVDGPMVNEIQTINMGSKLTINAKILGGHQCNGNRCCNR